VSIGLIGFIVGSVELALSLARVKSLPLIPLGILILRLGEELSPILVIRLYLSNRIYKDYIIRLIPPPLLGTQI
jgi:hypothetical protein